MSDRWLSAAHVCAEQGWFVLPTFGRGADGSCRCGAERCRHRVHPRVGLDAAARDAATLAAWAGMWPAAELAVACGRASGVVVLEACSADGAEASLASLTALHGPLPPTVSTRAGRGIVRYFFRHAGGALPASFVLAPGLTVLGDGGLAPVPSELYGSRTHSHRWLESPGLADLAPAPAWLTAQAGAAPLPAPVVADAADALFEDASSLMRMPVPDHAFLAAPYVARGSVTLLAGPSMVGGKTTLALDLARAAMGAGTFAGARCAASRVVLMSDLPAARLARAMRQAGLDAPLPHAALTLLRGDALRDHTWDDVVDAAIGACRRREAELLIVDTLDALADALAERPTDAELAGGLARIAEAGVAVVATTRRQTHALHPAERLAALGALAAAADVACWIEPLWNGSAQSRKLTAVSRLSDDPAPRYLDLREGRVTVARTASQLSLDAAFAGEARRARRRHEGTGAASVAP